MVPECHAEPMAIALHSFTENQPPSFTTNEDGSSPVGVLMLIGSNVYGTANLAGHFGKGTLFRVATNGAGFTVLHHFGSIGDGGRPDSGLTLSGNKFYGTTSEGAANNTGGIYSINTDGTGYVNFYSFTAASMDPNNHFAFTNKDGTYPFAGPVILGGMAYGTAVSGGKFGAGTVFAVRTNGTGFTNLHNFASISTSTTNSEGASPYGTMILSGSTLYGLAYHGGSNGFGTIYSISTNGAGFTNLHHFASTPSDGGYPYGALLLADNALYGTTSSAGSFAHGTVFKINLDGSGFATLHDFSREFNSQIYNPTNADGGDAICTLILSHGALVGVARSGGLFGDGTVFSINTNGNNFAVIHQVSPFDLAANTNAEGAYPTSVILSGNALYGAAPYGGAAGRGAIFALTLPSPTVLDIALAATNVAVSWPIAAVGYQLESTTNLPVGNWSEITDGLAVVDTNFVFSSSVTNPPVLFRLRR